MSKQSEAKSSQGYKLKSDMCMNCLHYRSELELTVYGYSAEKNIRCDLGGFATKKTATCARHELRGTK